MSDAADAILNALKKKPYLLFEVSNQILKMAKNTKLLGPWEGPIIYDHETGSRWRPKNAPKLAREWVRRDLKGTIHGVIYDGSVFEWFAEPREQVQDAFRVGNSFRSDSGGFNISARFHGTGQTEDLADAKARVDKYLRSAGYTLSNPEKGNMLLGPWTPGTNSHSRSMLVGSHRGPGSKKIALIKKAQDSRWAWGILSRYEEKLVDRGKEVTLEAAQQRVDLLLRDRGWEMMEEA